MPAISPLWFVSDTIPVAAAYLLVEEPRKQVLLRGAAVLYLAVVVWFLISTIDAEFDLPLIAVEFNLAP